MTISRLRISIGGMEVQASAVLLHSVTGVRRWQTKIAEAQNLLGGFSTGVSIIGSPGEALAGAAAIGILEAAVSNANQKRGLQLLAEAAEFHERLLSRGEWVPVKDITGISKPHPGAWSAEAEIEGEVEVDLSTLKTFERSKVMADWNISREEANAGLVYRRIRQQVIFLPDDFVWLKGDGQPLAVRWNSVDAYIPQS